MQIEAFARDLAWGVLTGNWNVPIVSDNGIWTPNSGIQEFQNEIGNKWDLKIPSPYMLIAMGYLEQQIPGQRGNTYVLTKAAFELHKRSENPPKVFISYKHDESSAFALLLEARLRIANAPSPFIDKNIPGGIDWENHLQEQIEAADYFVCLIGRTTLDSAWVAKEIKIARKVKRRIISVCHNGKKIGDCPDYLTKPQGHTVLEESAAQYEVAVDFVLNALRLPTY